MTAPASDPMTAAMDATKEPVERTYFGEVVTTDAWFCVLERGTGKRLFDPTRDDPGMRRTAIKIEVDPLKGDFLISQECLSFETEWIDFTLPSLKALGTDLAGIKGKHVQIKRVPTGAQYTSKKDNKLKEKTAIVFERVFTDGADCVKAADEFFASRSGGQRTASTPGAGKVEEASLPQDLGMPPEQAFALRSLPALWKMAGGDADKFRAMLESNPLISKYYGWEHPHVQGLVSGNADDLFPAHDPDLPF